jgi:hypothetical protein
MIMFGLFHSLLMDQKLSWGLTTQFEFGMQAVVSKLSQSSMAGVFRFRM